MSIELETNGKVSAEEIIALRASVGWKSDSDYNKILEGTFFYILARQGNKLVGFLNVIGNPVGDVLIHDVCVNPEYQGRGIGTRMVHEALNYCRKFSIQGINVLFEQKNKRFFERFGFRIILGGYMAPSEGICARSS